MSLEAAPTSGVPRIPPGTITASDVYSAVAARRTQWDSLLWQVPAVSLATQAFLYSIVLDHEAEYVVRMSASIATVVVALLALNLMIRHRRAELADSEWLEKMDKLVDDPTGSPADDYFWPAHGETWRDRRAATPARGAQWVARIGSPGSVKTWIVAMSVALLLAGGVAVATVVDDDWLLPTVPTVHDQYTCHAQVTGPKPLAGRLKRVRTTLDCSAVVGN